MALNQQPGPGGAQPPGGAGAGAAGAGGGPQRPQPQPQPAGHSPWFYIGWGAAGLAALGLAGYLFFGRGEGRTTARVSQDYATEAFTNVNPQSGKQHFYVIESSDGQTTQTYRFPGQEAAVKSAARRIRTGDTVAFISGQLNSIRITEPHPVGEIPIGRHLVVEEYKIDKLRNFNKPDNVDTPIATLTARFRAGCDRNGKECSEDEKYVMHITGQTEEEADETTENLTKYKVLGITELNDYGGRGTRVPAITVRPTERGLEYVVPTSRIKWSDLYEWDVEGHTERQKGKITDRVHSPWEAEKRLPPK